MEVRRIGETFFAEVDDIDVSKGFDAAEWQAFYGSYLEHQVLVLHGQTLSAAQFHALGERFGPVEPHTVSMYHHDPNHRAGRRHRGRMGHDGDSVRIRWLRQCGTGGEPRDHPHWYWRV